MRVVIQRVNHASVKVGKSCVGKIGKGILVFLGVSGDDNDEDVKYLCRKIINMRIFDDSEGKMTQSVKDIKGELLVISQFTLFASTKKGHRPSYSRAGTPEQALVMYDLFIEQLWHDANMPIQTGKFGADMVVSLENDGPVTISIDSKTRE